MVLIVCIGIAVTPFFRIYFMARMGSPKASMQLARFYFGRNDGHYKGNYWLLKSAIAGNIEAAKWIQLGHDPEILDCFSWSKGQIEASEDVKRMRNELSQYTEEQAKKGKPVVFRSFN